ncbi:MAG: HNH endonuclease [Candidatus Scalindua sp.]|nr:HNH endonuclease [Candidatus Scalindua sp.]
MASQRYQIFAKSIVCSCCGLVGNRMVLDISHYDFDRNGRPHFNLYAELDGYIVLMTKDHIVPRSKGGKNMLENYQTMCCLCNSAKSDHDVTIEELRSFETVAERIKEINKLYHKCV